MRVNWLSSVICLMVFGLLAAVPAAAQSQPGTVKAPAATASAQAQAKATAPVDDEEAFDENLRQFGYWAGAAFACVAETKQADVERQVLDTFNSIGRLFGTDRAFFFAASFGRGTSVTIDATKCPEFLDKFQKDPLFRSRK